MVVPVGGAFMFTTLITQGIWLLVAPDIFGGIKHQHTARFDDFELSFGFLSPTALVDETGGDAAMAVVLTTTSTAQVPMTCSLGPSMHPETREFYSLEKLWDESLNNENMI